MTTRSTRVAMAGRRGTEDGFVLIWTAILVLPVLTMGMIFLLYSQACVTKLRAQLNAMNLVAIGTFGAEFDSNETLNAMAMLARWQGFSNAQPVVTGQAFPGLGTLIFNHDTTQTGEHKVAAFQRLERGRFSALLNNVTKIDTSGFSRAQPTKSYAAVVLDYSRSLNDDRSIDDLLSSYDVLDTSTGGPGPNGELIDPSGPVRPSNVRPKPHIENALPYSFDAGTRRWWSWNKLNMVWPDSEFAAAPGCVTGPENGCSGSTPTHRGAIAYNLTDLFMGYKRASAIVVGVTALLTRRMDVGIVGSPFPPAIFNVLASFTQAANPNDQPSYFDRVENDGFFWAWKYDEADITNIRSNSPGASPYLVADVIKQYSYDDPKSPFQNSVKISPERAIVSNLGQTGWRKLVKYGTFFDEAGSPYTFPKALNYLSPPLLELNRPPPNYPPTDSFVWNPGAYDSNTGFVGGSPGYPTGIAPFLASRGKAHPTDDDLPPELKDIREYTRDTGSPVTINAPLSKDKWDPGYGACKLYDYQDDGSFPPNNSANCDGNGNLPTSNLEAVRSTSRPDSPVCPSSYTPRCAGPQNPSLPHEVADTTNAPLCLYGFARCYPEFDKDPVCFRRIGNGNSPNGRFLRSGSGALVSPTCSEKDTYPSGHLQEPIKRGTLTLPSQAPEISNHSLFYLLFDALNTLGGTFLHSGVRAGLNRCKEARQLAEERGERIDCLVNIATDGRPIPNDWFGQPWTGSGPGSGLTETLILDQLEADVIELTGPTVNGRIFTWFLGKKGAYDAVLAQYSQLTAVEQANVSFVPTKSPIPGSVIPPNVSAECSNFQSLIGNGLQISCEQYNTSILAEQGYFDRFKSIMGGDGTDPKKVWVETAIPTTAGGQAQVTREFGLDIAELLALNKRQVEFNQ